MYASFGNNLYIIWYIIWEIHYLGYEGGAERKIAREERSERTRRRSSESKSTRSERRSEKREMTYTYLIRACGCVRKASRERETDEVTENLKRKGEGKEGWDGGQCMCVCIPVCDDYWCHSRGFDLVN